MASDLQTIKEITDKFGGKWTQVRGENLEAFYAEMGVNFLLRKLAVKAKPDLDIIVNDTEITIGFKTSFRSQSFVYKLNSEVEVTNEKGKFIAKLTYSDGQLVIMQTPATGNKEGLPVETVRHINDEGEMVTTFKGPTTTCTRVFVRAAS